MQLKWKIFIGSLWVISGIIIFLLVFTVLFISAQDKKVRMRADRILQGAEAQECVDQACLAGCNTLSDWKKAYYKMFREDTACATVIYNKQFALLKGQVVPPRYNRCYTREDPEFLAQEGFDYNEIKVKYMTEKLPKANALGHFFIPRKLNFVWITSRAEFNEKPKAFYRINKYLFHNISITPNWQHTLWVNDKSFVPASVRADLLAENVHIRSIDELPIKSPQHLDLKESIHEYASQDEWGMSSDIARDLVEYYEGGVYVDGDYKILDVQALEEYMQSYRSFFGAFNLSLKKPLVESDRISFLNREIPFFELLNAFIASEPRGSVISKKIDLTYRNIITPIEAPMYVQYPCNHNTLVLYSTGPQVLTLAFLLVNTEQDAILPHCYLFQHPPRSDPLDCLMTHKFGKHYYHGGWSRIIRFSY